MKSVFLDVTFLRVTLLGAALPILMSCSDTATAVVEAGVFGEQLFADPRLSESANNKVACSTCHASSAAERSEGIFPGYPLQDSAFRASWWGGAVVDYLDASNVCYVYFMRGVSPLSRDEDRSKALYEYLAKISPARGAPGLPLTVVKNVVDVPRGDPARGTEVFRAACESCHGTLHAGQGRITTDTPILPEISSSFEEAFPGVPPSLVVIEKVRHGQFFGVGGNMPFFSVEALNDADLGALLAAFGL